MSNESRIQEHNTRICENNMDLKGLFDKINNLPNKVTVKTHYLEGKNVIIVLSDGTELAVDISGYIGESELTPEQIEAINNMKISIINDELLFEYDEEVLDFNFNLNGNDLIVENNVKGTDFNINQDEELEVLY
jgi:ATP-dependent 26S proteasome regulatory subunit